MGVEFFGSQELPVSLLPATDCVLTLPPVTEDDQWGYVLDARKLMGFVPLPLPLTSSLPMPGTLINKCYFSPPLVDYTSLQV